MTKQLTRLPSKSTAPALEHPLRNHAHPILWPDSKHDRLLISLTIIVQALTHPFISQTLVQPLRALGQHGSRKDIPACLFPHGMRLNSGVRNGESMSKEDAARARFTVDFLLDVEDYLGEVLYFLLYGERGDRGERDD